MPECDHERLKDLLVGHIQRVGPEMCFEFEDYKTLSVSQAIRGPSLVWGSIVLHFAFVETHANFLDACVVD